MKIITEPTVYLIGKQTVVDGELQRFLDDHGITWESDSENAGEVIAEVAGRACYMSYKSPRPGGNKAYLHHILESQHGCYDAETEVLTEHGWKKWEDVNHNDSFATLNPDTKKIEYANASALQSYEYDGPMYRVDGSSVDLLVTPNHRMYVAKTTTVQGRKFKNFDFVTAETLNDTSCRYTKVGNWDYPNTALDGYVNVFKLLGFTIGDGHVGLKSNKVQFRLRRERKISYLLDLCKSLGLHIDVNNDQYSMDIPDGFINLFRDVYNEKREKQIPPYFLPYRSKIVLEALYDGLINSDGSIDRNGVVSYDTTSQMLAGQVQHLCLLLGKSANISQAPCYASRKHSFGRKPIHRAFVLHRSTMPEINKYADSRSKSYWTSYSGKVYCATVPNGTLYVRRNGKPVWCGNSVTEHAVFNFMITGVSRALSHELIRHRTASPSQLSQRYVDESVAEYVCPDIIRNDPELFEIWQDAVGFAHEKYVKLADMLNTKLTVKNRPVVCRECDGTGSYLGHTDGDQDCDLCDGTGEQLVNDVSKTMKSFMLPHDATKTDIRKAARQAARSVLPNATETKLMFTANVRAIRNILEQRGSRHAEPEIRKLAKAIYDIVIVESPAMFSDYQLEQLPDGTYEITTQYRKV